MLDDIKFLRNYPNRKEIRYNEKRGTVFVLLDFMGLPGFRVGDDGSAWTRWKIRGLGGGTERYMAEWRRACICLSRGYPALNVRFIGESRNRQVYVHHLILFAFVGLRPSGLERVEARHFPDRNPCNNSPTNLSWCSPKQNGHDQILHGTSGRLSQKLARRVRKFYKKYPLISFNELARQFKLSRPTVTKMVRGKWCGDLDGL